MAVSMGRGWGTVIEPFGSPGIANSSRFVQEAVGCNWCGEQVRLEEPPFPSAGLGLLLLTDLGENRQRPQSGHKPKSEHTNSRQDMLELALSPIS